jgi:hypothetical protein
MSTRASAAHALWISFVVSCTTDPGADTGADTTSAASEEASTGDETPTSGAPDDTTGDETGTPDDTTGGEPHTVPEFGGTFTVIGTAEDGLNAVRDLAFNPMVPTQLWTYNMLSHGTVIYFNPGTAEQTSEERIDAYGQHFMAYVSSAAFGDNGRFATCQESRNEWNVGPAEPRRLHGPGAVAGRPRPSSPEVGQEFPPGAMEGSHLDMLHQSPLCMGIAHDVDNVYWAFDGKRGNIVRYDFQADHGPGGGDHSDGIITRYVDATLTRVENIPGHMELRPRDRRCSTSPTPAADGSCGSTRRAAPTRRPLAGEWDGAEYTGVEGADYEVVVEGLDEPSGLALHAGRLFVSEHGTGDIIAFDLEGTEVDRMSHPGEAHHGHHDRPGRRPVVRRRGRERGRPRRPVRRARRVFMAPGWPRRGSGCSPRSTRRRGRRAGGSS